MAKRRVRLAHYYGIVAAVSFFVFLTIVLLFGGTALTSIPARMWLLPFAGAAMGCFFTFVCIVRFGSMGGSTYFTPTVLHIAMILAIVWAGVMTAYGK
ncbi:hypothetical protein [Povalibacter sp.]|uniref:hypothetical protein n=1 Tax=Povalibacter sp. TaxID=1962978 RepID=UPI002F422A78